MRVYVGQTRSVSLIARLSALGWGECVQPSEWPPRRTPYFLDNEAFKAWRGGVPLDEERFLAAVRASSAYPVQPDFIVVPDKVAAGAESLAYSLEWLPRLRRETTAPLYLVAQDGQEREEIERALRLFDGLFVGGSVSWKARNAGWLVSLAHEQGKPCHLGRAGTAKKARWARRVQADSVDSCAPLWSEENLQRFKSGLVDGPQLELAGSGGVL